MDRHDASRERPLSERLYQLLLLAYPRAFREEYGAEMLLAFRDAYRDARRERGVVGVLNLWSVFISDLVKTVCAQHARRWLARAGQEPLAMVAVPFTLRVAQRTDIGRARASNEDRCLSLVPDDQHLLRARGALFVVSDGMGDPGGDASELVVQQIRASYYQNLQDDLPTALRKAIEQAVVALRLANERKRACAADGPPLGATCVAAVLHERVLYVANVGDSRAYVLHAGCLRQVTRDHSLVARMVERGELTTAEARAHPKRSLIYRALGFRDTEADFFIELIEEGDTIVLCTDGLCGVVEDEELRTIVAQYGPEESVWRLIARANAAGGPDNIAVIVARVSALS